MKSPAKRSEATERLDAWSFAVRLLTAADRTECEVRGRLMERGEAPESVEDILQRLTQAGYLDDGRVARNAVQTRARRGFGSERIRSELRTRGIAEELIERVIAECCVDEIDLARSVLFGRVSTLPKTPREIARAARFLVRRGFPDAVVRRLLSIDEDWNGNDS